MNTYESIFLIGCIAIAAFPSEAQDQYYGLYALRALHTESSYAQKDIIPLPGNIHVISEQGQISYVPGDHLNTTRTILSGDNTIQVSAGYDAYGRISTAVPVASAIQCTYASTYSWDPLTRLYVSPTRKYDPISKSFLSRDPLRQTPDAYTYTAANPVNFTDRTGAIIRLVWTQQDQDFKLRPRKYDYQPPSANRPQLPADAPGLTTTILSILDQLYEKGASQIVFQPGTEAIDVIARMAADKDHITRIESGELASKDEHRSTVDPATGHYRSRITYSGEGMSFVKDIRLPGKEDNTGRHSPAIGLFHELLHAYNSMYDRDQFLTRRATNKLLGANDEEYYVVRLTNQAAERLGEDIRPGYDFIASYPTDGPFSTVPKAGRVSGASFSGWDPIAF